MTATKPVNLWTSNEHARDYLERADSISHRTEGESALLEFIPRARGASSTWALGTGACWLWSEEREIGSARAP